MAKYKPEKARREEIMRAKEARRKREQKQAQRRRNREYRSKPKEE